MSTRYLIAVALLAGSTCVAQAGVLPSGGDPTGTAAKLLYAKDPGGTELVGIYNGRRMALASKGTAPVHAGGSQVTPPGQSDTPVIPASGAGETHGGGAQDKGAIVVTPEGHGNTGGATVQLPIPARDAGGDIGADLPPTPVVPAAPATPAASVPEPSSIALMLAGMLGVAGIARRRTR